MKVDWSLLIIGMTIIINIILLIIIFRKNRGEKSLIIFMSILAPAIILDILIGLVFGVILIIPIIPVFLFVAFIIICSLTYFVKCNINPQTYLNKEKDNSTSGEIIQIDISRKLLQISNYSSIINFIWFTPLIILLFEWSTITATMVSISTNNEVVKVKLLVGIANFIRTGGPLIIVLFVLLMSICCVILGMIYTLTINGTIRYLSFNGCIKVNKKFLILMIIPIVNIFSNISISKKAKAKLERHGLNVGIFGAKM